MTYHVYENWTAHKAKIHLSDCPYCKYGKGTHETGPTRNGRWLGPFATYEEAHATATATAQPVSRCQYCQPAGQPRSTEPPLLKLLPETSDQNVYWLCAIAMELMREPCAAQFIETVRQELDLVDPLDERELRDNRSVPRSRVERTVRGLAEAHDWTDILRFLKYVYRPELIESDLVAALRDDEEDRTPEDELICAAIARGLHRAFIASGFHQLAVELFTNLFTEYALNGTLRTPPPLPSWFLGSVFELPFFEDHLVIAVCTRFSDLDAQIKALRSEFRRVFATGQRATAPRNPARDAWVIDTYQEIRETLPDQQEHDKAMAELLGHDESELLEATVLDELLSRFAQSEWKSELHRYDLTSPQGKRQAKNFLKQIVHRQKVTMRTTLEAMPYLCDP